MTQKFYNRWNDTLLFYFILIRRVYIIIFQFNLFNHNGYHQPIEKEIDQHGQDNLYRYYESRSIAWKICWARESAQDGQCQEEMDDWLSSGKGKEGWIHSKGMPGTEPGDVRSLEKIANCET